MLIIYNPILQLASVFNMNDSWVKNYRKIEEWRFYKRPAYSHLWQHLIRKARFKDCYNINGQLVKRGQVDFSLRQLANETGVSLGTVRNILKTLEISTEVCTVHEGKNNRDLSIISITNYEKYQSCGDESKQQNEQQVNSRGTAGEQQVNNSKNEKNKKNKKNEKNKKSSICDISNPSVPTLLPFTGIGLDSKPTKAELLDLLDMYPSRPDSAPTIKDLTRYIKSRAKFDLVKKGIENYAASRKDEPARFNVSLKRFMEEKRYEIFAKDESLDQLVGVDKFLQECLDRQKAFDNELDRQETSEGV